MLLLDEDYYEKPEGMQQGVAENSSSDKTSPDRDLEAEGQTSGSRGDAVDANGNNAKNSAPAWRFLSVDDIYLSYWKISVSMLTQSATMLLDPTCLDVCVCVGGVASERADMILDVTFQHLPQRFPDTRFTYRDCDFTFRLTFFHVQRFRPTTLVSCHLMFVTVTLVAPRFKPRASHQFFSFT